MSLEFKYIEEANVSKEEYLEFLKECYGDDARHKLEERAPWLHKTGKYKILLALLDNKIVGQACSYEVTAIANGKEIPLTWGIDNFVLSAARGKGVGKRLQKTMHIERENFSSAWYSPTNGFIKKKCGSRIFQPNYFPYYAVSKFLGIYLELALYKILKKNIKVPSRLPNFYYNLFNSKKLNGLDINEIHEFTIENIQFIQDVLRSNYDFYVKRDLEYMNWRYFENPSLKDFHILEINKEGTRVAIVCFSNARKRKYICTEYMGATLLDLFISDRTVFDEKDAIRIIVNYYKQKGIALDGINTIFNIPYFPKIKYPKQGTPFLSTYESDIKKPYISMMDQDMEQN